MLQQKKDWLKRFLDTGEAADFIIEYLLDVQTKDEKTMSNADYGAYARALTEIKRQVRERKNQMKIQSR